MFVTSLAIFSCREVQDEFDWPRWRGPNGDGISLETDWNPATLAADPTILWKAKIGIGRSNVVIKDNRLYTMGVTGDGNTVVRLNADTGQEIWRFSFKGSFVGVKILSPNAIW
jgi:outer membrane protein assembly factor BamB